MHFLTRDALLQKSMEMRLRVCKQAMRLFDADFILQYAKNHILLV